MRVFLLHKNQDFDIQQPLPWNEKELTQDLELNTLFSAMAGDDDFLLQVVRRTIFSGLKYDLETIGYRQDILKDCLKNPTEIRLIYDIAVGAWESRKKGWYGVYTKHPSSILSGSIGMMEIFVDILKQLKNVADESIEKFDSGGFKRFFTMLRSELSDEYIQEIRDHLFELRFRNGVLISYGLGKGNKSINPKLRGLEIEKKNWFQRLFGKKAPAYTFYIHPRDESGAKALAQLKDEALNLVANALAQSCDHILHFFYMMQTEFAFYIGCMNLHEHLESLEAPICFPCPVAFENHKNINTELYDVCLALKMKQKIVGNDLQTKNEDLVIITGANQGGKSTFLRSIGLSQLMMQCGMFVPAKTFCATICDSLFTHFKREEDITMKSGKLDEELSRMSDITDHITSNSMLLFNESFAATNEREGSEIAKQIVNALLEKRIKVFFVTHLYEFAHWFYEEKKEDTIFLRAERQADTKRTFKLKEGEPLETSYGVDVYNKVFGNT